MLPYINNEDRGRVSTKYTENTHHIVAKHEGGTNVKDNLTKLFIPVHVSYHRIFGTEKIRGAMLQVLKINSNAIKNTQFEMDILKVLEETDDQYYYKDGVYHKR